MEICSTPPVRKAKIVYWYALIKPQSASSVNRRDTSRAHEQENLLLESRLSATILSGLARIEVLPSI